MNPQETPARDHVAEKSLGKHWTVGSTNLHVALVTGALTVLRVVLALEDLKAPPS